MGFIMPKLAYIRTRRPHVLSALNLAIQADWRAESDYAGPALAMTTAPVRFLSVRPPVTFPVLFS
jgi:hypothetical protein